MNQQWSKYNRIAQINGAHYIYNSLSNALLELDDESLALLRKLENGGSLEDVPADVRQQLEDNKIVADDEAERLRIKFQTQRNRFDISHLSLTINPTLDCNFRCPYCFEADAHHKRYMTEEVEDAIVNAINTKYSNVEGIFVTWFGGEPLMNFKSLKSLSEKIIALGKPFGAKMITNGYLLVDSIVDQLDALKINSLQITVDGPKDIHDSRRVLVGGGGTFDTIDQNIQRVLKNSKAHVVVRVNVDGENAGHYVDVCRHFTKTIAHDHRKRVVVTPGFVDDVANTCKSSCNFDRQRQAEFLLDIFKRYKLAPWGFYPSHSRYECPVRNLNTMVIGPQGELYRCWNDVGRPEKTVGSIMDNARPTQLQSRVLLDYLAAGDALEDATCRGCFHFPTCGGGCPYERIHNQHHPERPADPCPHILGNLDAFIEAHIALRGMQRKRT